MFYSKVDEMSQDSILIDYSMLEETFSQEDRYRYHPKNL